MKKERKMVCYDVRKITDIKDMINSSAEIYQNKAAYLVKNSMREYEEISFLTAKKNMDELGTALLNLGLKGEKIAVIGENRYEWAISYLAVICGTGIVVPLDRMLPENEIESCIKRGEVTAVIYSDRVKDEIMNISERLDNVKYFIGMDLKEEFGKFKSLELLLNRGRTLLEEGNREFLDAEINVNEVAEILFTSGTTSESKAVMLSHNNLAFNIMNQCSMLYIDDKDIFLSILPIHHVYECVCGFLTPYYRGCTVAYCEGLKYIQKNMQEAKASIVLGVPLIFETMYRKIWKGIEKQGKEKLVKSMIKLTNALGPVGKKMKKKVFKSIYDQFGGNVHLFIAGAAAINPEVSKGFRDLGIFALQGYGLSECAPIVALNTDSLSKDDAAGYPLFNTEVKIVDKNKEGIGEIAVKGEHVMLGYYKNEEATKEVMKGGYFHTGDLGYLDEDGYVHITGRKKNVIITKNGKNVYPEEIEGLINDLPYVKECMVYGKKEKDDITLSVQVLPELDKLKEEKGDISTEEIKKLIWSDIKKINEGLVQYKRIKNLEIREKDFEKTTTMKIKRYKENVN